MYIYIDMVGSGLSNIEWYRGVRYTGFECVHRRATKQHGSCNKVMCLQLLSSRFPTKFTFRIVLCMPAIGFWNIDRPSVCLDNGG